MLEQKVNAEEFTKIPCELFYLKPIELVEAKLYTLQKIRIKEAEIISLQHQIKTDETGLWLTTDFKAEGCTNDTMRKAFIHQELKEDKKQLDWLHHDLNKFHDDLNLIQTLLEVKKG